MYPVTIDGIFCLLVLVPVVRGNTIATDEQIADFALRHRLAGLVGDKSLIARYKLACATGAYLSRTITDEDVQYFGAADAVKNIYMERLLPAPQDIGRQRLTGRDADAHR